MNVKFKIKRFNPEKDKEAYFQEYELNIKPEARVLDALMMIKQSHDHTLSFRKSCAHGVCGSDAMVINGKEALACKKLIKDVIDDSHLITVEPLRTLPVQRDLMVNQSKFFDNFRMVKPFLINDEKVSEKERLQSIKERMMIDDPTKCILCAACYSTCPVVQDTSRDFIGPAALVNAARFVFDNRDKGFYDRLPILDKENGVWSCDNHFDCTRVCPRGIKITKNINLTKKRIKTEKEKES